MSAADDADGDDWKGPFHGPYQQRISLEGLGFPGYDLRIGEDGQIQCWSIFMTNGSVDGRKLSPHNGRIGLCKDGKRFQLNVHVLWCKVVHGPPPTDGQTYTVDHIDQNHDNNDPYNLRWATSQQQATNRKKQEMSIKWVPFTGDDERRQFMHRWFIKTGHEVRQFKKDDGAWSRAIDRGLTKDGYVGCNINGTPYRMNRIITNIFGDKNDVLLEDIYDDSVIIEHIDDDKTNNHKDNLLVSNQSNNMKSWHESGKSNKRTIYAISKDDGDAVMRVFQSAVEAAREIPNAHATHISKVCRGKLKSSAGYYFSYEPF